MLAVIKSSFLLNSKMRQQVSYSKRSKLIIYVLGGAVVAFLVFMYYYQAKMSSETMLSGEKLLVVVINVECISTKTKGRLYFKNDKDVVKHVNLSYGDCKEYKIGDTISVYNNKDDDWYELDPTLQRPTQP